MLSRTIISDLDPENSVALSENLACGKKREASKQTRAEDIGKSTKNSSWMDEFSFNKSLINRQSSDDFFQQDIISIIDSVCPT